MRIAKLTVALLAASLGIGTLGTTALGAETGPWPQRPVRVIMPFGAGTANDITARHFAERLGQALGPTRGHREPAGRRYHRRASGALYRRGTIIRCCSQAPRA